MCDCSANVVTWVLAAKGRGMRSSWHPAAPTNTSRPHTSSRTVLDIACTASKLQQVPSPCSCCCCCGWACLDNCCCKLDGSSTANDIASTGRPWHSIPPTSRNTVLLLLLLLLLAPPAPATAGKLPPALLPPPLPFSIPPCRDWGCCCCCCCWCAPLSGLCRLPHCPCCPPVCCSSGVGALVARKAKVGSS